MAKTVETAVKAARAKSLGRAKSDRENQAAHQHAGEQAAVAHPAVQEANAAAVLPKVAAADVAQEVGALSPEATLAGDFSFAGVMADAAASTSAGGAYAGGFAGGASAFAQDSGSTDSVGSGVSGGGVSIPLILGGLAAAAGVAAAVSGGGSDNDGGSTPTPTPTPTPPPPPPPAANTAPTITSSATVSATEDTAANFTVVATDKEGGALTYTAGTASKGTVTGGANGAFTYTPNANFNGTDTVTITVKDAGGLTTTQNVTVNVAAVNDAPTISSATQTITVDENKSFNGTVSATDVDNDTLTYSVSTGSKNGTATIGNDGKFTYTPTANFAGTDSFVVTANDGKGGTVSQTVNVTVTDLPNIIDVKAVGANTDADTIDTTYNVSLGNYNYTITGFDAGATATTGDRIVGPAGVDVSLDNSNSTDGRVVLTYASGGQVATITLDGLTTAQDQAIFGANSFNTVFGSGALA